MAFKRICFCVHLFSVHSELDLKHKKENALTSSLPIGLQGWGNKNFMTFSGFTHNEILFLYCFLSCDVTIIYHYIIFKYFSIILQSQILRYLIKATWNGCSYKLKMLRFILIKLVYYEPVNLFDLVATLLKDLMRRLILCKKDLTASCSTVPHLIYLMSPDSQQSHTKTLYK